MGLARGCSSVIPKCKKSTTWYHTHGYVAEPFIGITAVVMFHTRLHPYTGCMVVAYTVVPLPFAILKIPSHQLTWNLRGGCWKTVVLLKGPPVRFQVSWWEGLVFFLFPGNPSKCKIFMVVVSGMSIKK